MPFQPGISGNPSGRAVNGFSWQAWQNIVVNVWNDYEPNELFELSAKISSGQKVPVSSKHAMAIVMLASALQKDGQERERMLDRIIGKAPQMNINVNTNLDAEKSLNALENLDDESLMTVMERLESIMAKRARPAEVAAIAAPVAESKPTDDPA